MTHHGFIPALLSAAWQRLTGREAAALRRQRDACAEEAGVLRRALDQAIRGEQAARRELDELRRDLGATEQEGSRAGLTWMPGAAVVTGDDDTLESAGEQR